MALKKNLELLEQVYELKKSGLTTGKALKKAGMSASAYYYWNKRTETRIANEIKKETIKDRALAASTDEESEYNRDLQGFKRIWTVFNKINETISGL